MNIFCKLMVLGALALTTSCSQGPTIGEMRCEYAHQPYAIDTQNPRFTWTYEHTDGFTQQSYRLLVASLPEYLETEQPKGNVWESGETISHISLAQLGGGEPLKPRTAYYWRVAAKGVNGEQILSPVASFETGFFTPEQWSAKWITDSCSKDEPHAPMLRREFEVEKSVRSARLYISGAAYVKAQINGQDVSQSHLDPGYTHYDKRNLYSALDVTKLLTKGENAISAVLGNGFYNAFTPLSVWDFENARWRNRARMICELHITYTDGSQQSVLSDGSWRTAVGGPYIRNNIYSGDTYDARREQLGWQLANFDDLNWLPAVEVSAPSPLLKGQIAPPIRASKEYKPVAVRSFGDTLYVFDFGVNMTGYCRLNVQGEAGTTLEMQHGELLREDGRVEMRNIDGYFRAKPGHEFQTDYYILSGRGKESWMPSFTYHGFRYVELRADRPIKLDKGTLTALFLHTDLPSVGKFDCSNQILNSVWEATRQSYLSNLTSIPTDCPQREKNGWTSDAYLSLELGLLNYDGMAIYDKWLNDIVDNQAANGSIAGIIPTAGWGHADWIGPVWDASMFLIPQMLYNYYGDLTPVEKLWPVWQKYMGYLASREDSDGAVTYGIGDWLSHKAQTPTQFTSTLYYYTDNMIMAWAAQMLGYDPAPYLAKAAQLRELINTKYYNPETGLYANGTQAAQGVALYMGVVAPENQQRVADNLAEMVAKNDYFLDFGTIGSKTVLRMLTRYGHVETAFKMAAKEEVPSWGGWIRGGYTTLGETWALSPEWRDASVNHVFLGDVAAWYVNDIVGINYDAQKPGFENVRIAPHFVEGLDWASASYKSVRGEIKSKWSRKGGVVSLEVTIPDNTTATIWVAGERVADVGAGKHKFTF